MDKSTISQLAMPEMGTPSELAALSAGDGRPASGRAKKKALSPSISGAGYLTKQAQFAAADKKAANAATAKHQSARTTR